MASLHIAGYSFLLCLLAVLVKKCIDLKFTIEDMKMDCYPHPILSQPHPDAAKIKKMDAMFAKSSEEETTESPSESVGIDSLGATKYDNIDHAEPIYLTGTEFIQKNTPSNKQLATEGQHVSKSSEINVPNDESMSQSSRVSTVVERLTTSSSIQADKVVKTSVVALSSESTKVLKQQNENLTEYQDQGKGTGKTRVETSVWCQGSVYEDRICHFHNLCYYPLADNFVFFHGNTSRLDNYQVGVTNRPLVQLSSLADYGGHDMFLVDFMADSAAQFQIKWVDQRSLIFKRFKPDNIMHVLHDDIFPLHFTLDYLNSGAHVPDKPYDVQLVFMEGWEPGDYIELYNMFTDIPPLYKGDLNNTEMVCFRNAFVGLSKLTTWYHYGYFEPQGPLKKSGATGYQIHHTVDYILSHLKFDEELYYVTSDFLVLLSRKESRRILNEVDLMLALSRKIGRKVVILSFETHSLKDMIYHVRKSIGVVGMHGSLLSLAAFLRPGSIVVELFPYAVNPGKYTPFKTMADLPAMDLVYRSWQNQNKEKSTAHPNYPPEMGGLGLLSMSMQKDIMEQKEVPDHLCCEDPSWLYHIYQDTEVDISAVADLVKSAVMKAESMKMDTEKFQLYPAPVGKVTCTAVKEEEEDDENSSVKKTVKIVKYFHLVWNPPQNMQDLRFKRFHYEIRHVTSNNNTDSGVYLVKETELQLSWSKSIKIWVRAVLDDKRTGPYSYVECVDDNS